MKAYFVAPLFEFVVLFSACADNRHDTGVENQQNDIAIPTAVIKQEPLVFKNSQINTGDVKPVELLSYAISLLGTSYKYASIDPKQGLDCSGFITYVFNHFGIAVPRSSKDFTNVNQEINLRNSKPGDLILFTGTDSTLRDVGHMGIISINDGRNVHFIHSTSGKAYGVTVTPLNKYYQGRYVKTIRVFKSND